MHIPDGFLDAKTGLVAAIAATAGISLALRHAGRTLPERRVPLLGLAAAFVFAAQMVNFPVAGGTSGHLVGAVLATVLLGPSAAIVVMTAVVLLQCLMFADGGLTALGANLFNMALVAPLVGAAVYRCVRGRGATSPVRTLLAAAFAAWCATVAAALSCAGQLAWSGTVSWGLAVPAMAGFHMVIGLVEAAITTLVVAAMMRLRPELLREADADVRRPGYRLVAAYGLLIALGLVVFVAPYGSADPDGLMSVAGRLGFDRHERPPAVPRPLAGYRLWNLDGRLSTVLAGMVGTPLAFLVCLLLARALAPPELLRD